MDKATFAAGCFWGVEDAFRKLDGVCSTAVGYAGGDTDHPTYTDVCAGDTGHAETVEIDYDPARVSYEQLLELFWTLHDPTRPGRKDQYRSAIFFHTPEQQAAAQSARTQLEASRKLARPVATEICAAPTFHRAEAYHQQYSQKRRAAASAMR